MTAKDLRKLFRGYMAHKGYEEIIPDSLVTKTFPTCFTISGGHRTGRETFPQNFQVIQRCHRFWDVEHVGDKTHVSNFEMLITNARDGISRQDMFTTHFKFLTQELGLNPAYFTVSFFGGGTCYNNLFASDEESREIFLQLGINRFSQEIGFKISPSHGRLMNPNFIANLTESLSGFRTEIYYHDLEIWTSALHTHFLHLDQEKNEFIFDPIKEKRVACGFGLERMLMAVNGYDHIEEVFKPTRSSHLVFDHIRGLVRLYHDGAFELSGTKNSGRRTVLNRYMINLYKHLNKEALDQLPFVIAQAIEIYQEECPGLEGKEQQIYEKILDRANQIGCTLAV